MPTDSDVANEEETRQSRIGALLISLDDFEETLSALNETIQVLAPHVEKLDSMQVAAADFISAIRQVPKNRREAVGNAFEKLNGDGFQDIKSVLQELDNEFENEQWLMRLWVENYRMLTRARRVELLHRSMVTAAVSSFEVLISAALRYVFDANPDLMGSAGAEKKFSLFDLKKLGSIDDATQLLVNSRIDDLLYGSFKSWSQWWEKTLKFGFEEVSVSWEKLNEIVERRHIIVHNGGRVSQRYIEAVPSANPTVELGERLMVDKAYVVEALSQLRIVGVLLAMITLIKLDTEHADVAISRMHRVLYESLTTDDWKGALAIADAGMRLKVAGDDFIIFKINGLLCRQRLGEDISNEVNLIDASALKARFELGVHSNQESRFQV